MHAPRVEGADRSMGTAGAVLGFVAQRMRDSWRIQLVIAAGILVSAILMAATSIYTRAVSDLSLTVTLRDQLEDRRQTYARAGSVPLGGGTNQAARDYIEGTLDARFGELESERRRFQRTIGLLNDVPPRPGLNQPAPVWLASLDGAEAQLELESGRFPRPPAVDGEGRLAGPIEAAMSAPAAAAFGLEAGSRFLIIDRWDECDREPAPPPGGPPPPPRPPCAPTMLIERTAQVELTGLLAAPDFGNDFWRRVPEEIRRSAFTSTSRARELPLIVPPEAMDGALRRALPGYAVDVTWISDLDTDQLDVSQLDGLQETFDLLRVDLQSAGATAYSPIESRLDTFERDLSYTQAPILLLLAQVVGIALFYVVIVSGVLVSERREELFSMRSRGASLGQVLGTTAIEGLILALVSAAAGPFIAAGAISLLGYTGVFSGLTDGRAIATTLTDDAFLLAAGGAIAAALFMLVPLWAASRTRVLAERLKTVAHAGGGANLLQRYYLDAALVLVAAGLIFEADLRGTVFERNSVGGLSADPLLLSTPMLFALAAALVILRILPWAYGALAWLTYDRAPLPVAATMRYVARTVGPSARLTILLMLAAALGTFAASWSGTVNRSLAERIQYETGVEVLAEISEGSYSSPLTVQSRLGEIEGVNRLFAAHRGPASAGRNAGDAVSVTLLGLDPRAAEQMLWFRSDLAELPYPELLDAIDAPPVGRGAGIPDGTETLRVWVDVAEGESDRTMWLRVRDGLGGYHTAGGLEMPAPGSGWTAMDVDFAAEVAGRGVPGPYALHGILFSEPIGIFVAESVEIRMDAVTAIDPDGRELIIEDFEDRNWVRYVQRRAVNDEITFPEAEDAVSGASVMSLLPGTGQSPGRRGAHFADPSFCEGTRCTIPAIVNEGFARQQRLEVGDRFLLRLDTLAARAQVAAIVPLFPTLRPDERHFLVVDYEPLLQLGAVTNLRPISEPTEAWLDLTEDPEGRAAAIAELRRPRHSLGRITDQSRMLYESGRDPLTAAGGSGILLVAFAAICVLLALAFLVSMAVTARQRRLEMALLRTMGMGRGAILLQLALEYAIVVGAGLALGALLGNRISLLLLGYLEIDDQGRTVLPPFVVETDWVMLGVSFGIVGGVLVLGVLATWRWFLRLELNRELRLTN